MQFVAPGVSFEHRSFTEMCIGTEAGSYLRLIDFVYHSTLGLGVIKKKKKHRSALLLSWHLFTNFLRGRPLLLFFITLKHRVE